MKSFLKLSILAVAVAGIATSPVLAELEGQIIIKETPVSLLHLMRREIAQFCVEMEDNVLPLLNKSDSKTVSYYNDIQSKIQTFACDETEENAKELIKAGATLCEHMINACNRGAYGNMTPQQIEQMKQAMQAYNLDTHLNKMKKVLASELPQKYYGCGHMKPTCPCGR